MAEIIDRHPTIDGVLDAWREALGPDHAAYANHVYRVFNLTLELLNDGREREDLVAVAAVFHDLGIWSHRTMRYLEPSAQLAREHLSPDARRPWVRPVELMITMHHKLLPYRGECQSLVESFRRADLCDLTRGLFGFGIDADFFRALDARFPDEGFRRRVLRYVLGWAASHPARPLPMLRF